MSALRKRRSRPRDEGRAIASPTMFAWLALTCISGSGLGCGATGVASAARSVDGVTHTYYIAADEVTWDYAPGGVNRLSGEGFDSIGGRTLENGPHWIGRTYKKAIYREYTDSTFSVLKPRTPEWEHLGFLGPLIRAEVGDTIRVVFRNNVGFPAGLHPHGVFYNKDSEGAPYVDGTEGNDKLDDGVPPGGTHTYVWPVPERAGPGRGDPSSVMWMYHSHTDEERDVNAGLMGPMLVGARGATRADGSPSDVDREFIVAFAEVNENESWYLEENIRTYAGDPAGVDVVIGNFGGRSAMPDPDRNFMETMNGFVFGHLPGLEMRVGDRVRWYLMSSTNFEFHAPHWHGNTVEASGMRTDVTSLVPMEMLIAEMVPDNPGVWLFHCHVADHLRNGMQATYTVLSAQEDQLAGRR